MDRAAAGPIVAVVAVLVAIFGAVALTPRPDRPALTAGAAPRATPFEPAAQSPAAPSPAPSASASPRPSPRLDPGMVWDPVHQVVLLYGGHSAAGLESDTWTWDGAAWSLRSAKSAPGAGLALAFDSARGQAVLLTATGTWTWDGAAWTQQHPQHLAPVGGRMAYDPSLGVVVLVPSKATTTWAWNGSDWSQLADGDGPAGNALVYDARSARLLAVQRTTWAFVGVKWTQLGPLPDGMPALGGGSAYAGSINQPVLFGGDPQFGAPDKLWAWDGSQWKERAGDPRPPARSFPGVAYDAKRGELVVFGGQGASGLLGDTWKWKPDTGWAMVP